MPDTITLVIFAILALVSVLLIWALAKRSGAAQHVEADVALRLAREAVAALEASVAAETAAAKAATAKAAASAAALAAFKAGQQSVAVPASVSLSVTQP